MLTLMGKIDLYYDIFAQSKEEFIQQIIFPLLVVTESEF